MGADGKKESQIQLKYLVPATSAECRGRAQTRNGLG
ncbi:hypothetical protein RKD24_005183 [Streptomyces calvus]|jgi:hypothetical protein